MDGKKKRKFNWDELSSEEEEEVQTTKKVLKIDDKKAVEEQTDKFKELNVKSRDKFTIKNEVNLEEEEKDKRNSRSTRGRKRSNDEVDKAKNEDRIIKSTRLSLNRTAKVESPKINIKETGKDKKLSANEGKIVPKKAINLNEESRVSIKKETLKEDESTVNKTALNILERKNSKTENNNLPNNQELDLPIINIKSVKMKVMKKDSCKKFNKQHLKPPSPVKTRSNKFTEIKVQLDEEQRVWLNELIQNYDGQYDEEFDTESKFYAKSSKNSRKKY